MLSSDFHCKENDVTTGAVLLHKILPETGWQPSGNHLEDSDSFQWWCYERIHRLRSDTTGLKVAAHYWIASQTPAGLQPAKMTRSSPTWTLWWCGTIVWLLQKRCTSGLFSTFHSDWRFNHEESGITMKRVVAKFMLKLLMMEQKQLHVDVSQNMLDTTNSDPGFMKTIITEEAIERKAISDKRGHYNLQWKSDKNTKHSFTQMVLAINWRYWQAGENSCICMKVYDHLMQVCFIEFHQSFAKSCILL